MAARVIIADDQPVLVIGLAQLIMDELDLEVIGVASSRSEADALIAGFDPDVVVFSEQLGGEDLRTWTANLRRRDPHVVVVVLTDEAESGVRLRATQLGVAFVDKSRSGHEVVRAIRRLLGAPDGQ